MRPRLGLAIANRALCSNRQPKSLDASGGGDRRHARRHHPHLECQQAIFGKHAYPVPFPRVGDWGKVVRMLRRSIESLRRAWRAFGDFLNLRELASWFGWWPSDISTMLYIGASFVATLLLGRWQGGFDPMTLWLLALSAAAVTAIWSHFRRKHPPSPTHVEQQPREPSKTSVAEANSLISYTFHGGTHHHITISEPMPAVRFPRGVHPPDDRPAFVRFRTSALKLIDSHDVVGITDNGHGDFTIHFDRPLRFSTLVCKAMPPTPDSFKAVLGLDMCSIRVVFDGPHEPEIVALRFDE